MMTCRLHPNDYLTIYLSSEEIEPSFQGEYSRRQCWKQKKKFITHHKRQRYKDLKLFFIFHRVYGGVQLANKRLTGSMQWPVLVWSPYEKWENTVAQTWSKRRKKLFLKWKRNFIVVEKDSKSKTVVQFHCCSCFLPFGNSFELSAITHHNKLSQYFGKQQKL